MAILYTCMECGAELNGRGLRAGMPIACGHCGHEFTVPLRVDMTPAAEPSEPEVFAPASLNAYGRRIDRGEFGGLGRGPVYAAFAAVFLGLVGTFTPVLTRIVVVALLVAAVVYLARQLSAAFALTGGRKPEPAAVVVRAALMAAVAGGLAIWGVIVHGRGVFNPADAPPLEPAIAEQVPPTTTTPPPIVMRPRSPLLLMPATEPVAAVTPPTSRPSQAPEPAAVVTDVAAERAAADAAAAARADDREARERLSAVHLRALVAAAADYAKARGRYPLSVADLPKSRDLRAAVRSPFDTPGDASLGYTVIAGGKPPAAGDPPVIYDAAELADQGATVAITAAGRLLYLDADEVAEARAAWAAR